MTLKRKTKPASADAGMILYSSLLLINIHPPFLLWVTSPEHKWGTFR
jgi:hypothetical protein